ncbi:GTPase activating factor [Elasticomyces elasticus]|uniref:GTPase activating factor n=1 Tax=Exophiala sideris TaxID=1016849 RepID=A0ABR0JTA6_9EURO|nr:GTPase activating factor [Elasticomyces elasticus]KAK5040519.1 GTPase activating factor [Exophiala sideris]KAK5043056.1 GTPase activating factor [Exophiala sideris]KAK5068897.1 GTPase activating factor [Exophiala sideris]KAK5186493.1 GTPase activating factor [Eurotiomycetes sp. CCFEE 6388]
MSTERNGAKDTAAQSRSRPQNVQRRSSRHTSSQDRHGRVFEDHAQSAIRAVTPDSGAYTNVGNDAIDGDHVHSPVLHSSRSRNSTRRPRETSASTSNTETISASGGRRRNQTRTTTKDDFPLDASPGSFITKTRKRLGSIATGAQGAHREEEAFGSIGFPSVVPSPDISEQHDLRNPPKTPRRPFSPKDMFGTGGSGPRSPKLLDIDSARILHLMKTTCGRMHGILFYRPLHTSAWASAYCAINVAPGSLVCQTKGEVSQSTTLISDLRGCTIRTHYDHETQSTYLSVLVASSGTGFQLRPPVPETFDSWLAALLCWQPLRPKGIHNKMTKPQPIGMTDKKPVSQRRLSDTNTTKSTAIVKVGKMLLWDGPLPSGSQIASSPTSRDQSKTEEDCLWRRVSCTLHENGTFRLLVDEQPTVLSVTPLSQLARCAIQRLDESVLRQAHCIAIYPQYQVQTTPVRLTRPMVLGLESNVALEAWFVLLRALTVPELYGPEHPVEGFPQILPAETKNTMPQFVHGMFRIERSLAVKLTEAKFVQSFAPQVPQEQPKVKAKSDKVLPGKEGVYAEIILGTDLRARTATRPGANSAFWAEEFKIEDIPATLSKMTLAVKLENPAEKEWTMVTNSLYDISAEAGYLSGLGGLEISSHDPIFGRVDVPIDDLEHAGIIDKWWPLLDNNEHSVGTLLARLSLEETVILMEEEYKELASLLQNFSNGLTTQIAHLLGPDLRHLSDILLDIFQASGKANEWISTLIEEEIDGIYRDTPPMRMRFSGRIHSNDSYESSEQRELLVRDLSRSATMEANLLFRGNSLVTKALDAHMRRLGKDYLEEVLGDKLRKIIERDPDCEVDPNRVRSPEQLEKNWANLLFLTSTIWKSIFVSAARCPLSLRLIFRHIRSCAEDRYGSFIRTVKYTSVSGFFFLRFFCPAILNPKLFGLIPDMPPDRTKRSFTLIAKSLNVLANLARFGTKEPWMEPMNKFLAAATGEFKSFIDEICVVSGSQTTLAHLEPQFAAPNQIKSRLPPLSREGLPSLPFLLDQPKLLAQLVELWVTHAPVTPEEACDDENVRTFHALCIELHEKSKECLKAAEQAERPDENSENAWEQLLSDQQGNLSPNNIFEENLPRSQTEAEMTALPQTADAVREVHSKHTDMSPAVGEENNTPSSSASIAWDRRIPYPYRPTEHTARTNSTNSSTASIDMTEEARSRPLPSSRDGPSKNRLFELMSSSSRKKGKTGEPTSW